MTDVAVQVCDHPDRTGTFAYKAGCRCPRCTQANTGYVADWRERAKTGDVQPTGYRPFPAHLFAEAACRDKDLAVFFPDEYTGRSTAQARLICSRCPVREGCRAWAQTNAADGIFGGSTPLERRRVRRKQKKTW